MTCYRWISGGLVSAGLFVLVVGGGCFPPPRHVGPVVRPAPAPRVVVRAPAPQPGVRVAVRTPVGSAAAVMMAPAIATGGAAASGVVSYPSQRVRYPLNITYPRAVSIYVDGHGLDPTVAIYDAYGNRIAYNDDGGSGLDSALSRTLAPGSYILEVSGYSSSTGPYTLTVN